MEIEPNSTFSFFKEISILVTTLDSDIILLPGLFTIKAGLKNIHLNLIDIA